ncbi:MAG: HPr(Ser) kinase/phosphatase [Cellulosilyticum sp.]|nr:HPr(Ser) kinase/phosphatase [Cellulosilyticum sp.]
MYFVTVEELVNHLELENLVPDIPYKNRKITVCDVNRPALQLAGFFKNFDSDRVQIIGKVESDFLKEIEDSKERQQRIEKFMEHKEIPCIIICLEEVEIDLHMLCCALQSGIPLFKSKLPTSTLLAEVNRWLQEKLAPRVTRHGILVDVYGEGVLIMGESGIGKSEAALELVRRGHRLVADDAVEIRKMASNKLLGMAPEITRYFIEVRGIGIVDVKELYGAGAVKEKKRIDLVVKLEPYVEGSDKDRLGLEEEFTNILGVDIPTNTILIRPGRNIAILCEIAAVNFREKKMGYNAAQVLAQRVEESIMANSGQNHL